MNELEGKILWCSKKPKGIQLVNDKDLKQNIKNTSNFVLTVEKIITETNQQQITELRQKLKKIIKKPESKSE